MSVNLTINRSVFHTIEEGDFPTGLTGTIPARVKKSSCSSSAFTFQLEIIRSSSQKKKEKMEKNRQFCMIRLENGVMKEIIVSKSQIERLYQLVGQNIRKMVIKDPPKNIATHESMELNAFSESYYSRVVTMIKASCWGDATALYELGEVYYSYGDDESLRQALDCYNQSAEKGQVLAQRLLGQICVSNQDLEGAEKWYQRAALQGDAESKAALAQIRQQGISRAPNHEESTPSLSITGSKRQQPPSPDGSPPRNEAKRPLPSIPVSAGRPPIQQAASYQPAASAAAPAVPAVRPLPAPAASTIQPKLTPGCKFRPLAPGELPSWDHLPKFTDDKKKFSELKPGEFIILQDGKSYAIATRGKNNKLVFSRDWSKGTVDCHRHRKATSYSEEVEVVLS